MVLPSGSIRFCISTCAKFVSHTLPVIIPSLEKAGVTAQEILVVCGGSPQWEEGQWNDVPIIFTPQNSFDYTALIEVVEHELENDYWFLLHDTCVVGPLFKQLVYDPPSDTPVKVALKSSPSMSIGLYSYSYLMAHKDRIMATKNLDGSPEALQWWKKWGVPNEDHILWKLTDVPALLYHPDRYGSDEWNYQGHADIYGTGMERRVEYFPQLDLFKTKTNWQGMQPQLCIDI